MLIRPIGTIHSCLSVAAALAIAVAGATLARPAAALAGATTAATTAWRHGRFVMNTAGVVSRSDIVLQQSNLNPAQYMPLGNGTLGAAVWAADGFTAQLNRDDTMPDRKSPGQVVIPGLAKMAMAPDFKGRLDLYNGVLAESGGGMTMTARVLANSDELVVDVTGADPATAQTAEVHLWSGRSPVASASGAVGTLAETWADNTEPGSSGQTFGSLAAITASGQDVAASVTSADSVQVSFKPNASGDFRVVVAAPHWAGGDAQQTAAQLLSQPISAQGSDMWWHRFWGRSGLVEMSSADGSAQYIEQLRTIYLYTEAASMRSGLPGSQAGVADLFNFSEDHQDWFPAGFWFWNLRMQVAANLSSGNFAENLPIYDLYLNNLANLQAWTKANMGGLPGICVPETMRFNGNGYYAYLGNQSCDENIAPSFNSLTITSGAELSLWIWQQYLDTRDIAFLRKYYPLMQQSAIFLLAYAKKGTDGLLHTVANSHEDQWDVQDPTTDIVAMQALFPAVAQAAGLLHTDRALAAQLTTAAGELPPYARTDEATHTQLLGPSADASGTDVIGDSYQPTAPIHNEENDGLEPVWPYGVIGDGTVVGGDNLTALADRTYQYRPTVNHPDWTFDAVDAARLDMASQVESDLIADVERFQAYPSGIGNWQGGLGDEPYIEQEGVISTAIDEALATDYDGTLRFAPAWPSDWDISGTISVQNGVKADVQVESGTLVTAAIDATHATGGPMRIRNPWQGQQVQVVDGRTGAVIVAPTTAATFTLNVQPGHTYLVEQPSAPTTALPYTPVTGTAPTSVSKLGPAEIGLSPAVTYSSLAASFNDVAVTNDTNTAPGNFDGGGASISAQALAAAGAAPGEAITSSGVTFTWPDSAIGTPDNTAAGGQRVDVSGSGSALGILMAGTWGPATGTGGIIYTDGTYQAFTVTVPDWFTGTAPAGDQLAVTAAYQNRPGNTQYQHPAYIYSTAIPLQAGKTVAQVVLPAVSNGVSSGSAAMHIFTLAIGG